MPGARRWSDGLHQAVEAKEGVRFSARIRRLATITFQNYSSACTIEAGRHDRNCRHTECGRVFENLRPGSGARFPPRTGRCAAPRWTTSCTAQRKRKIPAMRLQEIKERYRDSRQPVLVWHRYPVEKSERLSSLLKEMGVRHEILERKNLRARGRSSSRRQGRKGVVTVNPTEYGRAAHRRILLGGNPECPWRSGAFLRKENVQRWARMSCIRPPQLGSPRQREEWDRVLGRYKEHGHRDQSTMM